MRLLHAIFKHRSKVAEHKARHTGQKKPKHQGPKPHHTGPEERSSPRQFDRSSGEWHRDG